MDPNDQLVHLCYHCQDYQTRTIRRLIEHYRLVHSQEPNFSIQCGIDSCEKVYTNVNSYRKHIQCIHKRFRMDVSEEDYVQGDLVDGHSEDIGPNLDQDVHAKENDTFEKDTLHDAVGLFVLKVKETHSLPKTTVNKLLQDLYSVLTCAQLHQNEQIKSELISQGIGAEGISAVLETIEKNSPLHVLDYFGSEENQERFIKNKTYYVSPVEYCLDETKMATYMYVPILESLQSLLKHDDVLREVLNTHQNCGRGVLHNFCDGELYRSNPLFSMHLSLKVQLFF